MALALSGGQDLQRLYSLLAFRERSRRHVWAKPCLARTTYNAVPLHTSREFTRSKNDRRPTHGRSPVWRADPRRSYERNVTETHTSRGRPSGMELPDYPVMALIPTPWDQDGPALLLPARSFPVLVARSAPRRVFSRTRTSFCSPPGLFLNSQLVILPAGIDVSEAPNSTTVSPYSDCVLLPARRRR
jgi:hypothetical protein